MQWGGEKKRKHGIKTSNLFIGASYGELAGPEKLAVWLLPLAEPLYRPGKCVLHILTNFCPANINWKHALKLEGRDAHLEQNCDGRFLHWRVLTTDLHQDSLSMGGWMGASSSWLSRSSAIFSFHQLLITRLLVPLQSPPFHGNLFFHQTPSPQNLFYSGEILDTLCKTGTGVKISDVLIY